MYCFNVSANIKSPPVVLPITKSSGFNLITNKKLTISNSSNQSNQSIKNGIIKNVNTDENNYEIKNVINNDTIVIGPTNRLDYFETIPGKSSYIINGEYILNTCYIIDFTTLLCNYIEIFENSTIIITKKVDSEDDYLFSNDSTSSNDIITLNYNIPRTFSEK